MADIEPTETSDREIGHRCARCLSTNSGVWSHAGDPEREYCWTCWHVGYKRAEEALEAEGGKFFEHLQRLLETPMDLSRTMRPDAGEDLALKDSLSSSRMLGLVLILIPVSIFWLVVGFALGFWIGVT